MRRPAIGPSPPDEFDVAAEAVANQILKAEGAADESGGCVHTADHDDFQCWHCRLRMMTLIIGHHLRKRDEKLAAALLAREHCDCVAPAIDTLGALFYAKENSTPWRSTVGGQSLDGTVKVVVDGVRFLRERLGER